MFDLNTAFVNPNDIDPYNPLSIEKNQRRYETIKRVMQTKAINKHLNFIDYMWNNPSEQFQIGPHTKILCEKLTMRLIG